MSGAHHDEGHTVAGWAGFAVAVLGSLAVGLGVVGWWPGVWIGSALLVVAVLVAWGLHLAGWGKPPGVRPVGRRGFGVRDRSAREGHPDCFGCRMAGRRGVDRGEVVDGAS
ncbi:hypothetical protein ACWD6K_12395 [Streptomyces sp. NPDC002431]